MSETTTTSENTRDDALRKSYANASKRLREENLDRFNALRVEEAKKLGVEWTPPKTEEQKAEEEYAALIAKYPHLAQQGQQSVPDTQIEAPAGAPATQADIPDAAGGEVSSRI